MRCSKGRFTQFSKHKQKGVVAIEFAIGFMGFWLMCMAWIEMSYMSYVSAICDVTISQAAKVAKKADVDENIDAETYLSIFNAALENSDSIWSGVVNTENLRTSVRYVSNINELVDTIDPCIPADDETTAQCGSSVNRAIAIYRVSYDFTNILTYFMGQTTFIREVIVVQEYGRSQFEID